MCGLFMRHHRIKTSVVVHVLQDVSTWTLFWFLYALQKITFRAHLLMYQLDGMIRMSKHFCSSN